MGKKKEKKRKRNLALGRFTFSRPNSASNEPTNVPRPRAWRPLTGGTLSSVGYGARSSPRLEMTLQAHHSVSRVPARVTESWGPVVSSLLPTSAATYHRLPWAPTQIRGPLGRSNSRCLSIIKSKADSPCPQSHSLGPPSKPLRTSRRSSGERNLPPTWCTPN